LQLKLIYIIQLLLQLQLTEGTLLPTGLSDILILSNLDLATISALRCLVVYLILFGVFLCENMVSDFSPHGRFSVRHKTS